MAEKLNTTRRAVLSGLATAPMAALPTFAYDSVLPNPDHAFQKALADFKEAVRNRWPDKKISFCTDWDEDGDAFVFRGIMAVQVVPVTA